MPPEQQPLSGDIQGFAPSHPDMPDAPPEPIKAPKGRAPASVPTAQAPLPQAPPAPGEAPSAPAPAEEQNPFQDPGEASPPLTPAPVNNEPNPFQDPPDPDTKQMRQVVTTNLDTHRAINAPLSSGPQPDPVVPQDPLHNFVNGIEAGLQISVTGLGLRGKMPTTILPEQADLAMRIGKNIGMFAGDLPAMMAGGIVGGAVVGGEGVVAGSVAGPVGAAATGVTGAAVGAGAGAFALPAALRKILTDHYEKGDITDRREFVARLMATSWEAVKGGVTGAATAATGGIVGPVAGKLAGAGSELVAMTTVGAALEGHLPTAQDFIDGAIVIGGLHGVAHIAPKLRSIYAATGERPEVLANMSKTDVELQQQMTTGNSMEPAQATLTKLEHNAVNEPAPMDAEGVKTGDEKILGTKTELTPKNDDDLDLLSQPERPKATYDEAQKDFLSKIGIDTERAEPAFKEKMKQGFDDFYAKSVDFLDPLKGAIEEAKRRGAEITDATSAYVKGRLAAAHMDKVRSFLENGTEDGAGNVNGEGLNKIYRDIPDGDMDGFRAYAMAKRALELFERPTTETKAPIVPWKDFDPEKARTIIESGREKFEDVNQRRIGFENRVMDYAREKGLFSQEQIDAIKSTNEQHLPFNRAFEPDFFTGDTKGGAAIKEIVGSERNLVDPILQTYKNTEMLIKRGINNEVRSTMLDNLRAGDMLGEGLPNEDLTGKFLNKVEATGLLKDNQLAVYVDGERQVYEGTPGVIDSLKRLDGDKTAMDITTKILRGFSNMVRVGVVSNPAFGFAHFFRSQIMSGVYSKTGMIPFVHSSMALADFMGNSDVYRQFISDGGATGSLFKLNETYLKDNQVFAADKEAPFIGKAWNAVKSIGEASEGFIKLTDNMSRFAEYKRSIEQGEDRTTAAFRAREVVPDYAMCGLQRSALRTGVAFIGAHINSMDRMKNAFIEDRLGTAMKMSALTAVSAILWVVNRNDEAIDAIPDWQKNTYWNINISRFSPNYKGAQDATILRLPKPWAPGILFGTGAEVVLDSYFKDRPQEVGHFAESLVHSVFPEAMPNIAQPIMDQYSNKQAFTGRPLVPEWQQKLLPEMMYKNYTSETAKAIAKIIGYVPLVKDIGPSADPLASPAVVENYIKTWGGTLGGWALKASDWAGRGFSWDNGKAEPWENTPFIHQFLSRYPSFQDQRIQDFYENKDTADKAYNSVKALSKKGDFDAAQAIMNAHPDFQVRLNGISKAISTARKAYENVQEDPGIPPTEKRQLLDTFLFQIGSMAKEGNQMMSDFHKQVPNNKITGKIAIAPQNTQPTQNSEPEVNPFGGK